MKKCVQGNERGRNTVRLGNSSLTVTGTGHDSCNDAIYGEIHVQASGKSQQISVKITWRSLGFMRPPKKGATARSLTVLVMRPHVRAAFLVLLAFLIFFLCFGMIFSARGSARVGDDEELCGARHPTQAPLRVAGHRRAPHQ